MNNRRLFSIDLDGTLLRPDYTIGPFTKSLLPMLVSDGDIIFLSSGRPIRTLYRYYKELGLTGPISCYNGAYIGQPENPLCFPLFDPTIARADIIDIVSPFLTKIPFFMGEDHSVMAETSLNPFLDKYFPAEGTNLRIAKSLNEIPEKLKIFIFSSDKDTAEQIRKRVEAYPAYAFHSWKSEPYYEIILKVACKGEALKRVAAYYDIPKENIFAFGDSENDFEMLAQAGHPFALKGCKSQLLSNTFPSTEKGNDQEGVAFEILKYCD